MLIIKYFIIVIIVFIFQSWTSEFFSLGTIDPDFCVIAILYISVRDGRLNGVFVGFFLGLIIDLSSGLNQYFGLTPLIYTITGYFSGFLKNQSNKLNKTYFTGIWVSIIVCQFLIFSLIVYQEYLIQDSFNFIVKWIATSLYTLTFLGILQFIIPIYKMA
jgi:rod shape-determining protein MreD